MTGVVTVRWHVAPATPPVALRHCGTCRQARPFHSSGKIRLNANGRKLDAWLIYKCQQCDRTWNRTIYERMDVGAFDDRTLHAMQHSHADWVRRIEQDDAALRRQCARVAYGSTIVLRKPRPCAFPEGWQHIEVRISVSAATGNRLDRVLAQELRLSRSALGALVRAGLLTIAPSPKLLRKSLRSDVSLKMNRAILTHLDHDALKTSLFT